MLEFMQDYIKLHSGRIPVTLFRRALDLCRFPLSQEEVAVLEQRYLATQISFSMIVFDIVLIRQLPVTLFGFSLN